MQLDPGFEVRDAIGARIQDFRVEIEGGYGRNASDKVVVDAIASGKTGIISVDAVDLKFESFSVGANAYVDIPLDGPLRPYVAAGFGWSPVDIDISNLESDDLFTFRLMGGLGHAITDRLTVTADDRYTGSNGYEFSNSSGVRVEIDRDGHSFGLGLRYAFHGTDRRDPGRRAREARAVDLPSPEPRRRSWSPTPHAAGSSESSCRSGTVPPPAAPART